MKDNELINSIIAEKFSKIKISFPWFAGGDFFLEVMSHDDREKLYNDLMAGKSISVPDNDLKTNIEVFLELKKNNASGIERKNKKKEIEKSLDNTNIVVNKDNLEGFIVQQIEFIKKNDTQNRILLTYDDGKYDLANDIKTKIDEIVKG